MIDKKKFQDTIEIRQCGMGGLRAPTNGQPAECPSYGTTPSSRTPRRTRDPETMIPSREERT